MTDARHPAAEALDLARDLAEAAHVLISRGPEHATPESVAALSTASLAWSAVAFLSRDIGWHQQQSQRWAEHIQALGVKPPVYDPDLLDTEKEGDKS